MAFSVVPGASAAEKFTIKMAGDYPDKHPTVRNGWKAWIAEMKEKSDGRLNIRYFNPNTLTPNKDNFNSVVASSSR